MRKAYNEIWIENLYIQRKAEEWTTKNLLTGTQLETVKSAFPENFYRPGMFVKIGLFCFGIVACSFFVGFLSLLAYDTGSEVGFSILNWFSSICFLFFLEYLIKTKSLFHSGIDNSLLYAAVTTALVPMFFLFNNAPLWMYCSIALIVLILSTLRYADVLGCMLSFTLIVVLLSDLMLKSSLGKVLLPFEIMAVSAFVYWLVCKNNEIYYRECRQILEALSLAACYFGGNYLVVREANAMINGIQGSVSPQIAFAPLFYFFTWAVPVFYIVTGARQADRIRFVTGLLAFAFSVYTFAHYFSTLTASQELVVAGALLITVSVGFIKYLHRPRHGISDERDRKNSYADLEAIVAAQQLGVSPADRGLEFGGGEFGGGGAGEVY